MYDNITINDFMAVISKAQEKYGECEIVSIGALSGSLKNGVSAPYYMYVKTPHSMKNIYIPAFKKDLNKFLNSQ